MNKEQPRVLVCTVGPWSDSIGSNTMSELFQDYPKDKLACLYIRADISDSNACLHYFHIYEGRVMKSIFRRGNETGSEYKLGEQAYPEDILQERARYDYFRRRNKWFYTFAREWVWLLGKWKSKELNRFLESFSPDIIVFPIESYIHFNRINEYIINKIRPSKVISYLWDDNFTYKQHPRSIGFKVHRWWLKHGVKRLIRKSTTVFAICPKMKREVDACYGIDSVVLTKPIYFFRGIKQALPNDPLIILYTGKLLYGRDETLAEIISAIQRINKDGRKVILHLYTNTILSPDMKKRICVDGCCEMKGFVPQSEVTLIQQRADVLLFAEALSESNLTARLSFSTKITDYLASGNCIWAVGHKDMAPIEYIKEEDAGIVSTDLDSIYRALKQIVVNPSMIQEYALKAQECGKKNHNKEQIMNTFYRALNN